MTDEKPKRSETRQRQKKVFLRVTDEEAASIEQRAADSGLTVAGYLRACVFGKDANQPRAARRPTIERETLARLLGELGKEGGNLHQIVKGMNYGDITATADLRATLSTLRELYAATLAALGKESKSSELMTKIFKGRQP